MNQYKQIKRRLIYGIFRLLREDIVRRLRANGISWTKTNGVLRALGQKQIVKVVRHETGETLTYAYVLPTVEKIRGSKAKLITPVTVTPEFIEAKNQTS